MANKKATKPVKTKDSMKKKKSIFFKNIRARRESMDLSQKELAAKLEIPHQRISELENGAFVESPEKLISLAKALNCSLDYLFGLSEKP